LESELLLSWLLSREEASAALLLRRPDKPMQQE
jgi:hypothetical protein